MKLINVVKPTHICNLNCNYCFNDDIRQPTMNSAILEDAIRETFEYARNRPSFTSVEFVWHGGEPLVIGIDYFREAIEFQKKYSNGVSVGNCIQTNGLLLDDEWVVFLKANQFSVSLSLDGTREIHDQHRKDFGGKGSFQKVMNAIALLRRYGIEPGVMLVATQAMKGRAFEIYQFLVENNLYFHIVSLTKSGSARLAYDEIALSQTEYAELWTELFDLWFSGEAGYVRCKEFEGRLSALVSGYPFGCEGHENCADTNIATDPLGNVYTCSTLSGTSELCYGNIGDASLESLMLSNAAVYFRTRKIDPQCASCNWQHVCHGGCMSRSYKMYETIDVRDNGCESLWKTWDHISKCIRQMGMKIANPHPDHLHREFSLPGDIANHRTAPKKIIPIKAFCGDLNC